MQSRSEEREDESNSWCAEWEKKHDPCDAECLTMTTYRQRVASFAEKKWKISLTKSATCNPMKMAVMWYCRGPDAARCFACFKELEGWEAQDDPFVEHTRHCSNCPLVKLNLLSRISPTTMTLRDVLRFDSAVEFARKRVILEAQWQEELDEYEAAQESLEKLMKNPPRDVYDFYDENAELCQSEL